MKTPFITPLIIFVQAVCYFLFMPSQTLDAQRNWVLNEKEYFMCNDFSILFFHNIYPVGKQGGIEFIHHDTRIATNGNIHFILREGEGQGEAFQAEPIPPIDNPKRICNYANNSAFIRYQNKWVHYELMIQPDSDGFIIRCVLPDGVQSERMASLFFGIEIYPELYKGKSFHSDSGSGLFPWTFSGQYEERHGEELPLPLASGTMISLAPEDPSLGLQVRTENATLELLDVRGRMERGWFSLRAYANLSENIRAFSVHFLPSRLENWKKPPLICCSQAGYHPSQPKRAVMELDPDATLDKEAELVRIMPDGNILSVLKKAPQHWGNFLRYQYAIFDFSEIRIPGIYKILYDGQATRLFPVSPDVYKNGIWQPSLEVFIPVQMCHMRVTDRNRIWHGECHLDDALQAPAPLEWFDGFDQSADTETSFLPNTTIPGMNTGGWHDAGDDDINTGSTARTIYHLSLAMEEFGIPWDQTTVDVTSRKVVLHQSDGIHDAVQQIIHGLQWILPQYRYIGHSVVGVISNSWATYLQSGDWGLFSDNLFYNPSLPADSSNGKCSGTFDDRYAFTNKDSRREYFVAATLAAASRVLITYDQELAAECLRVAQNIWNREETGTPTLYPSVGTPGNMVKERTNAAVELFLATKNNMYIDAILQKQNEVMDNIESTAWTICRLSDNIKNTTFLKAYEMKIHEYAEHLREELKANPFGIHYNMQVWGIGWNVLWSMVEHFFLIKAYPDLFPPDDLYNALQFVLGMHPGSDLSFVSGVGSHPPIPAFGLNRSDYAYIPGGVYSGTATILPDFPELKSDHPFLWQQSEYIISGAAPYIFCVLAADKLLND